MNKETIEYFRNKGSIYGYGYITPPKQLSENNILDFLCKWSSNKNVKIYSHAIRRVDENVGTKIYKYFGRGQEVTKHEYERLKKDESNHAYSVPYCDTVFYIDIWYQ